MPNNLVQAHLAKMMVSPSVMQIAIGAISDIVRRCRFIIRAGGTVLQNTPENFKNTGQLAIGANDHYNPKWTFRGTLAFHKSPVQQLDMTPRLRDADRTLLAVGAHDRMNPTLTLDVGYIFIKTARIDANGDDPGGAAAALAHGLLNGHDNR